MIANAAGVSLGGDSAIMESFQIEEFGGSERLLEATNLGYSLEERLPVRGEKLITYLLKAVARGQEGNFLGLARHRLKTKMNTLLKQAEPIRLMGAVEGGKTFRHELYPEYKAHRPEKAEDFRALLQEAPSLLACEFGMEVYYSPGFEADDVLAAIADQCIATQVRLTICSNDKDLLGLAYAGPDASGTYVLHSEAGSYHALGPNEVLAKKGVPPHRIALLHALQGCKETPATDLKASRASARWRRPVSPGTMRP